MPNRNRLATFVQASDLHFGDIDPVTFQPTYPPWMVSLWTWAPFLEGLAGHEYDALRDLASFFAAFKNSDQARLLMTGDLTSSGSSTQFAAGDDYLRDVLVPPQGSYFGLGEADWRDRGIPGNHDHWPGTFFSWRGPLPPVRNWLNTFPAIADPPLPLTPRVGLRFLRLATDADVFPLTPARLLARGEFTSQLLQLDSKLPDQAPDEIRVLLLHHSYEHQGLTLEMNPASRALLEDFLFKKNIPVILTGHTHEPLVRRLTTAGHPFLEGRCGTTTQADQVPLGWPWRGQSRTLTVQTLLVHRLFQENDGTIVWHAETYRRHKFQGFVKAVATAKKEPFADELIVWRP
jgi:hypothetical protein